MNAKSDSGFPRHVYLCPGSHNGGKINGRLETYEAETVETQEDFEAALSAGWSPSLPEAAARFRNPPPLASRPAADSEAELAQADAADADDADEDQAPAGRKSKRK